MRGVGAGRSAARAPGGAPRSPARHARCIRALRARPLAGNGLLPSPGLSFPAALRSAGAPRTPPGRFRALHITRALCAEAARRSAHQLARAGAWRRRFFEVGGFEDAARRIFARAFGAGAVGASRSVLRFARGICGSRSCASSIPRAARFAPRPESTATRRPFKNSFQSRRRRFAAATAGFHAPPRDGRGTESDAMCPVLTRMMWLPRWRATCHPSLTKACATFRPERSGSFSVKRRRPPGGRRRSGASPSRP